MAYFLFCNFVIFAGLLVDATNTINECEYIIHEIKFNDVEELYDDSRGLGIALGSRPLHTPSPIVRFLQQHHSAIWLHDLCLKVLTVHGNDLCLFICQGNPPTLSIDVISLI